MQKVCLMQLNQLTITQSIEGLKKKKFSCLELTRACLKRIKEVDGEINAFITVCEQEALKQAVKKDVLIRESGFPEHKKLFGIPVSLKDILSTKAIRTTAGSKILDNYNPVFSASAVEKIIDEGAVIIGKNNCDAFAYGGSGENSGFGPTKNPWDFSRVPGGSSSGPTAAVSADEAIFSLGTDTGGSIRQPAGLCSVVGLKPTYGRVSRFGLIAMGSSFDTIGPLAKTVKDAAIILQTIAGYDKKDATTSPKQSGNYLKNIRKGVKNLKIGLPKEYFIKGMQEEVTEAVKKAAAKFEGLGAKIVPISLPHTKYALAVYYILITSEISSNMGRFDGIRFGFRDSKQEKNINNVVQSRSIPLEDEVKRRIILGTYSLSSGYHDKYYEKASKVRTLIKNDYLKAFQKVDAIITPTSPNTAWKLGEKVDDPLQMYLTDIFTETANVAGIPGISIPCGFDKKGLPIGLQILGKHFDEETILKIAYAYEQATQWHKEKPKL